MVSYLWTDVILFYYCVVFHFINTLSRSTWDAVTEHHTLGGLWTEIHFSQFWKNFWESPRSRSQKTWCLIKISSHGRRGDAAFLGLFYFMGAPPPWPNHFSEDTIYHHIGSQAFNITNLGKGGHKHSVFVYTSLLIHSAAVEHFCLFLDSTHHKKGY